jgi:hypothetical protein
MFLTLFSASLASFGPLGCSDAVSSSPPPPPYVGGTIAAAMNDVSILFPLPSIDEDIGNLLSASSAGARGSLLPSDLYASFGPLAGSTNPDGGLERSVGVAAYSDLHVVAMRIDPCFASLAPDPHGAGCDAQMRLILQEVRDDGSGSPMVSDSGLHAFYALTREEFLTLAKALVALRESNDEGDSLGPLAPHPIMVRQGLGGAMSAGVAELILQYAGAANLKRVAQFNSAEAFTAWSFKAANVVSVATVTMSPFVIPTLGKGGKDITLQTVGTGEFASPLGATFTPATTSDDNLVPLAGHTPKSLSSSARQAAFDSLVRIENPRDNSPNTIDCGSCHLATPTERLVAVPEFSLDDRTSPLAFQPDGTSVVAADMTPTFNSSSGIASLNLHAFSYVGRDPGINQRVVNETASVVEYLNHLPE